jgi:hypothetical protein
MNMKITINQLRRIIKEEVRRVTEAASGINTPPEELKNIFNTMKRAGRGVVNAYDFATRIGLDSIDDFEGIEDFYEMFDVKVDDTIVLKSGRGSSSAAKYNAMDVAEFINYDYFDIPPAGQKLLKDLTAALNKGQSYESIAAKLVRYPDYTGQSVALEDLVTMIDRLKARNA